MRRVLVAMMTTLLACAKQSHSAAGPDANEPACDLVTQVGAHTADAAVIDCGALSGEASPAELLAAHDCALDAIHGQRAFQLVHWLQGEDTIAGEAFASRGGERFVSVFHYNPASSGGLSTAASVDERSCRSLTATPTCQVSAESLCLDCLAPIEASVACAPARSDGECHGPGHYEAGKEGN